jgi:hypothetical protein
MKITKIFIVTDTPNGVAIDWNLFLINGIHRSYNTVILDREVSLLKYLKIKLFGE